MASLKFPILPFLMLFLPLMLSSPVLAKDKDEDTLLQGLNSYRTSLKLPSLSKNEKAGCLADKLAHKLEDRPCPATQTTVQFQDYPDLVNDCGIDINHTTDGVILPVCVKDLVPSLVLTNYTRTANAKFVNDSRFSGAGLGSEDDWMVLVLSTDTVGGNFAGAVGLVSEMGLGRCLMGLLIGIFVFVVGY